MPPNGLREMPDPTFALARMMRARLAHPGDEGGVARRPVVGVAGVRPAVVRMSRVSYQSLMAKVMPWSGPTSLPVALK